MFAGETAPGRGKTKGIPDETLDAISDIRTVFKGPLTTVLGTGGKSPETTLRKLFELYANVRVVSRLPGVRTSYSGPSLDMILILGQYRELSRWC